jgi:hypothetical protein
MDDIERKMLVRLTFEPEKLSRNKNFETFEKPEFKRIRKRAAHLRALLELLEESDPNDVKFRPDSMDGMLELRVENIEGGTRMAFIPPEEYDVLFDDEEARELLEDYHEAPLPEELPAP